MGKRGRPRKIAGNGRGSVAVQVASLGDSLVAKEQSVSDGGKSVNPRNRVLSTMALSGRDDGIDGIGATRESNPIEVGAAGKGRQKEGLLPTRGKHAMDGIWVVAKGGPKPEMVVRGGIEVSKLSRFQILQDDKLMEMEGSLAIEVVARSGHEEGIHAESSESVEVGERDRQVVAGDHDSRDLEREGSK
ncbi:hypothetical protein Dimus_003316 [Dionaea muscipula]